MALRIGNKEVIKQETLLIPQNETAEIPVTFDGLNLIVTVSFSEDESGAPNLNGSIDGNTVNLNFINWNNVVGTGSNAPIEIAKSNTGRALLLMAACWFVGTTHKLDLQFTVG